MQVEDLEILAQELERDLHELQHYTERFSREDKGAYRSLLQEGATFVSSAEDLVDAIANDASHIVVEDHLDFSHLSTTQILNWTAIFHVTDAVKSIKVRLRCSHCN
jgi:hypothetical protein